MAFDYKKEFKDYYQPKSKPHIISIPPMKFVAVRGEGNPNEEAGEYAQALGLLYGVSFTIKMSHKTPHHIDGFFGYALPPLEGFWWMEGMQDIDYSRKDGFQWISAIRLPDFVDQDVFDWAAAVAANKKKTDFSRAEFLTIEEGLCVQCLHAGPYDDEPPTILAMDEYARAQGYDLDFSDTRHHHEIYLNDPRKCAPERLKTVIRHPIKPKP